MKIFTDKKYREHIEQIRYEWDKEEHIRMRLDRLTEDLHRLECRVQVLEGKCNPAIPVCDNNICYTDGTKNV